MKDLAELLNQSSLNTSIFPPIDLCQEFFIWTYLLNKKVHKKDQSTSKTKIKNVFYGVMLGILILQKNIQKELEKMTKKLLKNLIMIDWVSCARKKILARLRWKTIYALTPLVMKMSWFFQFMFQIKILRTQWICCI